MNNGFFKHRLGLGLFVIQAKNIYVANYIQ